MATGYAASVELPLGVTQAWQWLTDIQGPCPWLPAGISLQQQDSDELGRGSVVQVERQHHPWSVTVTYWEPPKALELIRKVWYGTLVYRLQLTPTPATEPRTAVQLQVGSLPSHGPEACWIRPLLWFERRRIKKWLAGLPVRRWPGDEAAQVDTLENREVV